LKQAEEDREISNLATQMVPKADGGFEIPAPLASTPLASTPLVKKALQKRQEQELASRRTKSEIANLNSLAKSRDAQVKLMENPQLTPLDKRKELEAINKHREQIEKTPVTITGETPMTLGDIIKLQQSEEKADQKKWKRLQKKLLNPDGTYQSAYAIPFLAWEQTINDGNEINKSTIVNVVIPDDDKDNKPKPDKPPVIPPKRVTLDDPLTPTNLLKMGIQALPERKPYSPPSNDPLLMMGTYGGM